MKLYWIRNVEPGQKCKFTLGDVTVEERKDRSRI